MPLKLYNTFSKGEEEFTPLEEGKVRMYTCGPTVYGRPHIGNYSSFLMADLLRRWLEVSGYTVTHVKNITDVGHLVADADEGEDKVEKEARRIAREQGREAITHDDVIAVAREYEREFLEDEKALHILKPAYRPRASETIPEMIQIIGKLLKAGHVYETDDGLYFSVESFPDYGKLSGNTLDKLDAGARVEVKEVKRHPADFALWKKCVGVNERHVLQWDSPWGRGFPGWHIECSAMSQKFLGPQIDIHTGGEDNIFPHHECEVAQSECSGPKPFVKYWLHKRRIDIGSTSLRPPQAGYARQASSPQGVQKMSKSLGNVLSISDIEEMGYSPLDLRYYFLSVHYRTQLKFTKKGLDDAKKARRKIIEWIEEVAAWESECATVVRSGMKDAGGVRAWWDPKFFDAMNADLNTPEALSVVFDLMALSRNRRATHGFTQSGIKELHRAIDTIAHTFGCFDPEASEAIPAEVQKLVALRAEARSAKNFKESDRLRDEIASLGYEVRDTAEGQKVTK